jgi:hypothetical protein
MAVRLGAGDKVAVRPDVGESSGVAVVGIVDVGLSVAVGVSSGV